MANDGYLERSEEDRRHVDRVWMYDDAWMKQGIQDGRVVRGIDVPEEEYREHGVVGLLTRYPLLTSFLILAAGGLAVIVIGLLVF